MRESGTDRQTETTIWHCVEEGEGGRESERGNETGREREKDRQADKDRDMELEKGNNLRV